MLRTRTRNHVTLLVIGLILVSSIVVALSDTTRDAPGSQVPSGPGVQTLSNPTFDPPKDVDPGRDAYEPIVSVDNQDRLWVSGMHVETEAIHGAWALRLPSPELRALGLDPEPSVASGSLWNGYFGDPGFAYEAPSVDGNADATIHVKDGRHYWSVLRDAATGCNDDAVEGIRKMHLSIRDPGSGTWGRITMFEGFDRPFFVPHVPADSTVENVAAVAYNWCTEDGQTQNGKDPYVFHANAGGWVSKKMTFTPGEVFALTSQPRLLPARAQSPAQVVVPVTTASGLVSISPDGDPEGIVPKGKVFYLIADRGDLSDPALTWAKGDFTADEPAAKAVGLPWSAVDASGRLYVVWREGEHLEPNRQDRVMYAAHLDPRATGEAFKDPIRVSGTDEYRVWDASAVAGADGRLAVAWYSQPGVLANWQLRMRYVINAHTASPTLLPADGPLVVDANVADATVPPVFLFREVTSMDELSDGNVVIAYVCHLAAPTSGCSGGTSHLRLARQNGGSNLRSDPP